MRATSADYDESRNLATPDTLIPIRPAIIIGMFKRKLVN